MIKLIRVLSVVVVCLLFSAMVSTAEASAIRTGLFNSNTLAGNDDGSTGAIGLGFDANFFGVTYNSTYVNNNGNVTFTDSSNTFTPSGLSASSLPIIAPYFADVDTRSSDALTYGTNTLDGHLAFGVDWVNVGYFSNGNDRLNSFQLILIDRSDIGVGDFDIEFNYDQIQWEAGNASGGSGGLGGISAAAGYSNGLPGDDLVFYELPGSLVNGALLDGGPEALTEDSNVGVDGRYLFNVRNGEVSEAQEPGPVSTPEPSTFLLLGAGLVGLAALGRKRFNRS